MPFRIALSGLNAASAELQVIGNNVANASTVGFKQSRAEFADIFATSSLGTTANAIGAGVRVASIAQQFTQGNIGFTDNNLDLAISGQGFFIVDDNGVQNYTRQGQFRVDRDGYVVNSSNQRLVAFQADSSGNITGARDSLRLDTSDIAPQVTSAVTMGINLDASDVVPAAPVSSDTLVLNGTVDADNAVAATSGPFPAVAVDNIYDSYGIQHQAQVQFVKTAANTYDAELVIDGVVEATVNDIVFTPGGAIASVDGTAGITDIAFAEVTTSNGGTVTLTADGALMTEPAGDAVVANQDAFTVTENGNGAPQRPFDVADATTYNSSTSLTIYDSLGSAHLATMYYRKTGTPNEWEMYTFINGNQVTSTGADPTTGAETLNFSSAGQLDTVNGVITSTLATQSFTIPGTGAAAQSLTFNMADVVQYGSAFSVNVLSQDGFATGRLSGVDIADTGVITARFTNGQSRTLGQVALANFQNSQGLRQLGDTTWGETFESGAALVGSPGSGSLGLIESGALEGSNVDLTEQLVGMITAQRNFQANAQVITTADTVTQTIINIR